jgi:two-component system response regulator AlgR
MKPLRLLLVDDEPLATRLLRVVIDRIGGAEIVGTADDGQQALRLIDQLRPDVVILDVEMPGLSGLDVVDALAPGALPAIIFVTAFDHYAVKAFELGVADYLVKPVEPRRLEIALDRVRHAPLGAAQRADAIRAGALAHRQALPVQSFDTEFWVQHRQDFVRVRAEQIEWVQAEGDYVRLHVADRSYLMGESMSRLETRLDPSAFMRVHRSSLIRTDQIDGFSQTRYGALTLTLAGGKQIPVGRTYARRVRDVLAARRSPDRRAVSSS